MVNHNAELARLGRVIEQSLASGNLPQAIQVTSQANQLAKRYLGPTHPAVAGGLSNLAFMYFQLGELGKALRALQEAFVITGKAGDENSQLFQRILSGIRAVGDALRDRYDQTKDAEDLRMAIEAAERTVDLNVFHLEAEPTDLNSLAARLIDRYERTSLCEDLDRAIGLLDTALKHNPAEKSELTIYINNLVTALHHRYRAKHDPQDLYRATDASQKVVAFDRRALPTLLRLVAELIGNGQQNGDRQALDQAYRVIQQAPIPPELVSQLLCDLTLAWMALHFSEHRDGTPDLDRGIQTSLAALAIADKIGSERSPSRALAALLLLERFELEGDQTADRDQAIRLAGECVDPNIQKGSWDIWLPSVWGELGSRLAKASNDLGNLAALDAAIRFLTWAKNASPDDLKLINNVSIALRFRFELTEELADINAAVAVAERAVTLSPTDPQSSLLLRHTLASALWFRYHNAGQPADLERGLELCRLSFEQERVEPSPFTLNGLAIWLVERFSTKGDLADLNEAIDCWNQAVELSQSDLERQQRYLINLIWALRQRAKRTDNRADLQHSINIIEKALKNTPADSQNKHSILYALATVLHDRFELIGNLENLADVMRAIGLYREARALTTSARDVAMYENGLANALSRIGKYGHLDYLNEAIELQSKLLSTLPNETSLAVMVRANLGSALRARYDLSDDEKDYKLAVAACETSFRLAIETQPEVALLGARNWGDWEFRRRSWKGASRAYAYVRDAIMRLVQIQAYRSGSESWLRETQGVFARAAYVEAKLGNAVNAVHALEFGSARLLSEQLQLYDRSLERLKGLGHTELYNMLIEQLERVRRLEHIATTESDQPTFAHNKPLAASLEPLRAARKRLGEILDEVQRVEGFSNVFQLPSMQTVYAALNGAVLIYIAATEAGGLALLMGSSNKSDVNVIWLPELDEASLRALSDRYLEAYENWRRRVTDRAAMTAWMAQLDQTTERLWRLGMERLVNAITPDTTACLIPMGTLALLPLHAAWSADEQAPSGRRYALDSSCFTYFPNSRSLIAATNATKLCSELSLLAVADPQALVNSVLEAEIAASGFARHHVLQHRSATRDAVLAALPGFSIIHLACHGLANPAEPLDSGLMMAANEQITLRDLLDARLDGVRLAILSACETAVPGRELPDEIVNLPTGFLYAGAAATIASLWVILDISTMILMARFYWLWRHNEVQPSKAMRLAQLWVRDSTNSEKVTFLDKLLETLRSVGKDLEVQSEGRDRLLALPPNERTFAQPFYWAAFIYVGA